MVFMYSDAAFRRLAAACQAVLRLRYSLLALITAVLLAVVCGNAWAAKDALVSEAAAHLRAQQPKLAYELLLPHEVERAGDPDFDLVFGAAASQVGEYTKAIMALERAVDQQPENTRAIAELGKAYFAVRDNERARAMFEKALDQGVPTEAGKVINQFISNIELAMNTDDASSLRAENYSRFSYGGRVQLAIGHDSNVGRAPSQNEFYLPRLGRTAMLNRKARKRKSAYVGLDANVSGRYTFNHNWAWTGSFNLGRHSNRASDSKRSSSETAGLSTGVIYYRERHELSLLLDTSLSRLKDGYASRSQGVNGSWTYHLDGFRRISTSMYYGKTTHLRARYADNRSRGLSFTYARSRRSGHYWFAGLNFNANRPKLHSRQDLRSDVWSMRAGGQYYLRSGLSLSGSLSYGRRRYGGIDFFYGVARKDRELSADASLNWAAYPHIVISPSLSYRRLQSNVKYHSFDRKAYAVSASYTF